MCVGFWTLDHPDWSLVLCANRDEVLDRPTLPASWHDFTVVGGSHNPSARSTGAPASTDTGSVLSGIDVQAGGTWMGINRAGRIALITNITEPIVAPHRVSRGAFVASYLDPDNHALLPTRAETLSEFLQQTVTKPGGEILDSAGFNLLLLEPRPTKDSEDQSRSSISFDAALLSNSGSQTAIRARPLNSASTGATCSPDGTATIVCDGLSNAIDGSLVDGLGLTDPWTKVAQGKGMLGEVLGRYNDVSDDKSLSQGGFEQREMELVDDLMRLLGSRSPTPISAPRDMRNNIFIPAGMHIRHAMAKWYGTRLSSVLLVRRTTGEVLFVERDRAILVPGRLDGESAPEVDANMQVPKILTDEEGRDAQRIYRFTITP